MSGRNTGSQETHSSALPFQDIRNRIKTARGIAESIHLPDRGSRGNSHMLMMDANNLQVADIILAWLIDKVR